MPSSDNIIGRIIFAMFLVGALAGFGWTIQRYVKRIIKGREEEAIPHPLARLFDPRSWWDVILYWGLQWRVKDKPGAGYEHVHPSYHHLGIFWGCVDPWSGCLPSGMLVAPLARLYSGP